MSDQTNGAQASLHHIQARRNRRRREARGLAPLRINDSSALADDNMANQAAQGGHPTSIPGQIDLFAPIRQPRNPPASPQAAPRGYRPAGLTTPTAGFRAELRRAGTIERLINIHIDKLTELVEKMDDLVISPSRRFYDLTKRALERLPRLWGEMRSVARRLSQTMSLYAGNRELFEFQVKEYERLIFSSMTLLSISRFPGRYVREARIKVTRDGLVCCNSCNSPAVEGPVACRCPSSGERRVAQRRNEPQRGHVVEAAGSGNGRGTGANPFLIEAAGPGDERGFSVNPFMADADDDDRGPPERLVDMLSLYGQDHWEV